MPTFKGLGHEKLDAFVEISGLDKELKRFGGVFGELIELEANIVDFVQVFLDFSHFVLEHGDLNALSAFESLHYPLEFCARIALDNGLDISDLLDSIFDSVNLSKQLIPFLEQIALNVF